MAMPKEPGYPQHKAIDNVYSTRTGRYTKWMPGAISPKQCNSAVRNSHGKKVRHLIGFPEMAVASVMELRVEVATSPSQRWPGLVEETEVAAVWLWLIEWSV